MWKSYTVRPTTAAQPPQQQEEEAEANNDINNLDPTTFQDMIEEINNTPQPIMELNIPAPNNHIVDERIHILAPPEGTADDDDEKDSGDDPTYIPEADGDDEHCRRPKRRKIVANQSDDNDNTVEAPTTSTSIEQLLKCDVCMQTFINQCMFSLHLKTDSHLEFERQARLNQKLKNQLQQQQGQGQTEPSTGSGTGITTIVDSMKSRPLHCQLCNVFCHHPSDFKKHLATKRHIYKAQGGQGHTLTTPVVRKGGSTISKFRCNICNIGFIKKEFLKMHIKRSKIHQHNLFLFKTQHTTQEFDEAMKRLELSIKSTVKYDYTARCTVCNLKFWHKSTYRSHLQTEGHKANVKLNDGGAGAGADDDDAEYDDEEELSTIDTKMLKEAIKKRVFTCRTCQVNFANRQRLKRHFLSIRHKDKARGGESSRPKFKVQRGGGSFKCPICRASFGYKYNLSYHIREKHQQTSDGGSQSVVEPSNEKPEFSDSGADSSGSSPDEAEQAQLQNCIMKNKHDHLYFKCGICDNAIYYYELELKLHAKTAKHLVKVKALEKYRAESQDEEDQGLSLEQLKEKRRKIRKEEKQKEKEAELAEEDDKNNTSKDEDEGESCSQSESDLKSTPHRRRPLLKQKEKTNSKLTRGRRTRRARGTSVKKRLSKKVKEESSEEDEEEENDINWSEEDSEPDSKQIKKASSKSKTKISKIGREGRRPPKGRKGKRGKTNAKTIIDKGLKKEVVMEYGDPGRDQDQEENQTEFIEVKTEEDDIEREEECAAHQDPFLEGN